MRCRSYRSAWRKRARRTGRQRKSSPPSSSWGSRMTTSSRGSARSTERGRSALGLHRRLLRVAALRTEDQARRAVLLGHVDRGVLQRRRELLRHEDAEAVLLRDLVVRRRVPGEAEADGDLAGLGQLGEDAEAVLIGDGLLAPDLGQQRRSAGRDLEHGESPWGGYPVPGPQDRYHGVLVEPARGRDA